MKIRIPAKDLRIGDITITGEVVTSVDFIYTGSADLRKKVYLTLDKNGKLRIAEWNKATVVAVERAPFTLPQAE